MARPIEFDRPEVVKRAMALFWRQGFQATSLVDLVAAMGISRSSFYAAFGDKRRLFVECLDLFARRTIDLLERARAEMPPADALQAFFEPDFMGAWGARNQWGCMLVNTVLEMAGVDDDLAAHASRHLDRVERLFRTFLQDAGATPALAEDLAAMLMLLLEGVRVSARRPTPGAARLQPIATTFRLVRNAIATPTGSERTREITA
ncbi:TetR/AcrR family transcriptional regulator [Phenylobacterium sp.]|jgi:TetR/AcrR family transcriptional repressor of nem operon|uniref:TetR/AcrR family transcriptional regulator n=1 Tax=Phenylobacterium sp. TaxID=1871053 RepID=UPI0037C57575